ncbi:hypothetical protein FN924_05160 [Radiobacillus deserti]|uniref:Uncharacterized protein n=2 Tax=Radiobacillus deserti TaxID=2594883 RepID=A0A516KDZ9_9BACI|nr:hypothetical protein FN924_05160 [Radiobacillus deserti]
MQKEKVASIVEPTTKPDLHLSIISPKRSTSLVDSEVWFNESGATIGLRSGKAGNQVDYFNISKEDADFLYEQFE